jgi:hypothetical protein
MFISPFGRTVALVVPIVLGFTCALAETGGSAMPRHQGFGCSRSTDRVQQLATIESENEARFQCLGISVEGETVKALRLETHRFASGRGLADREQVVVAEFLPAVVEGSHGAVLDGVPGHDAIILQGKLAMSAGKIRLVTSYLYNGFTGEYRTCQITLGRTPDEGWRLFNRSAQSISHIVIKTRQIPVIGAFGIAGLEGACS